ncbi:50S ribosomal protein L25 [Candidatus Poribacteria bacterium]|nr:50S ribosomal protein L25 [Candidatus Poribacteria bacterium]
MEQARLEAQFRNGTGKGAARELRRNGEVPAIVYGHKQEPINIQLSEKILSRFLHSSGENVIINMDLGKDEPETVMLKELQIDPISRRIVHADFVRVSMQERITTPVRLSLVGTPPGVEEEGGVLEFPIRELQVECRVMDIPENIEVEISWMSIGDQIRVEDIKLEGDMIIHDDPTTVVVLVTAPTMAKELEELEEAEELGILPEEEEMEPEVIGEKREEDEEEEMEEEEEE